MTLIAADATTTVTASDTIVGVGVAVVTSGIVFVALVAIGFVILVRRGRRPTRGRSLEDLATRANIALVRLDDDVSATADELGFAIAQFGRSPTSPLESALATARANLAAAFALKQKLDDATADSPTDSPTAQRESIARILLLCETAAEKLHSERTVFDEMRGLERSASHDLDAVRESLADSRRRMPQSRESVMALARKYSAEAIAPVADIPAEAERLLAAATLTADEAAARVDDAGVSSVASTIRSAECGAREAARLLDHVERHGAALAASSARLVLLAADARAMATEAKRVRDAPPDPRTGALIADAIARVENTVRASTDPSAKADPDDAIARIDASSDLLDTAIAGARNEAQRLTHAREALEGALLTARSQLATTRAYIDGRRSGAGARTRLAEAARLLAIAEAESDPVIALDTARSSATHSRDADALARYDLLH